MRALTTICIALTAALAGDVRPGFSQDFLSPKPMVRPRPEAPKPPVQPKAQSAASKFDIDRVHGEWVVRCWSQPSRTCQIMQQRVNGQTKALVILLELTRAIQPKRSDQLAVMLPLGMKIAPAIDLRVNNSTINASILTCVQSGCLHNVALTPQHMRDLQGASELTTYISDLQGKSIQIQVPLRGFKEAILQTAQYLNS